MHLGLYLAPQTGGEQEDFENIDAVVTVRIQNLMALEKSAKEAHQMLAQAEKELELAKAGMKSAQGYSPDEIAQVDQQMAAKLNNVNELRIQIEDLELKYGSKYPQVQQQLDQAFAEREEYIRTAEFLVNEHAEELERERAALLADQAAWQAQKAEQRQAIEELRAAAEGELADRRLRLDARQQWIERQKTGLEQVRDEALSLHRQSLEMRLIAEQVWTQITGAIGPAQATQTIAQLRLKLAEQYRLEEDQLAARRQELVQLGERIGDQHRELTQLKNGVRDWASVRQAEIEQQAATLVERELTLDAQQQELLKARHQWDCERRAYEQQIRELTCQLRADGVPA